VKTELAIIAKHGAVMTPNEIDVMAEGNTAHIVHFVSLMQVLPGSFSNIGGPVVGFGVLL